jgi:hypothetical protein
MRDNKWAEEALQRIWDEHFNDIERKNEIKIHFGRKSKRRLGSIILTPEKVSLITLTGIFKDDFVPDYVVEETIAHELIHYIHGFSSTLDKKYKYPHQGGIIRKEMEGRGLGVTHIKSRAWMTNNWQLYVLKNAKPRRRRKRRGSPLSLRRLLGRKVLINSTF